MEAVLVITKWVWIAHGPIDFKQELEHTSVHLEEVHDEAVAVSERVWAVDAHLQDLDGWVRNLRKRMKAGRK